MKKLMIALAAVVVATVSQAASIAWGGAISLPDGMTEVAAGTGAYLVYSASTISDTGSLKFDGTDLKSGDTTIASTVSSYTITDTDASGWSFMSTYDKSGSDVNGYYAILVGDAPTANNYSFYSFEITGTTAQSTAVDAILGHNWDPDYLTQGGYTVTGAVPEPTSGLLILLGMAGLALRRRRA